MRPKYNNIDEELLLAERKKLSAKLREYREEQNLTTQQLSDKIGISRTTITKIESGKWNFGIDTLLVFAKHLGFPVNI